MTSLAGRSSNAQRRLDCGAVFGLALCAFIAALAPQLEVLQPQSIASAMEPEQLGKLQQSNASVAFSEQRPFSASRRDNTTLEAALEASVMGAYLADAASLGLHGLYDTEQLRALLRQDNGSMAPPEFWEPQNVEYEASQGAFSAYAYETLPIMHTLMSQSGLEAEQFSSDCFTFFSGYNGHINAAMREWTSNIEAGLQGAEAAVDSDAAHALVKVPLLAARYAGNVGGEMQERLRAAISVHQCNRTPALAGEAFAAILERMTISGATVREATEWAAADASGLSGEARAWLQQVLSEGEGLGAVAGVQHFGQGEGAVKALQSGLHVALHADSYHRGVRQSIVAGGSSTSRAHVVGALLGAQHGEGGLPKKWRRRAAKYMDVKQMAHVIIVQRSKFVPFLINRDPSQQPVDAREGHGRGERGDIDEL